MPTIVPAALLALVLAAAGPGQPVIQTASGPDTHPNPAASTGLPDVLAYSDQGDRMTVPVTIAGTGPYGFIVDTGAQRTVISRELAGTLRLEAGRTVRVTAMSGTSDVGTVVIPAISVGAFGGTRIEAPALEGRNIGAPGLLGIDTLQGHAVTIDFARRQMTVTPAIRQRHAERAAPDEIVVHAKNLFGQLVVTDAYYRGRRIQVILDTGSVVSMGNLALRKEVERSVKGLQPISLLGVTGEVLQADYTQVPDVKVAGVHFSSLPIAFADAAPFRRFSLLKRPALLLGMDALKLFKRVRIDFANREVRFLLPDDTPAAAR